MSIITSAKVSGVNGGTTSGINGTGGKIAIAHLSYYIGAVLPSITDSYGNTWYGCGIYKGSIGASQIYFAPNLVTGAGHTFTLTPNSGTPIYSTLTVEIHDGITTQAPYAGGVGANAGSASSLATGSLSYGANALLSSGFSPTDSTSGAATIDNSFTISQQNAWSTGNNEGGAQAYKYPGAAGSVNPTWTCGAGSGELHASLAAFHPDTVYTYSDPLVASQQVSGVNGGTTPSFNSTGANFLLVSVAFLNDHNTASVSDNKGNTFTPCTRHDQGNVSSQFFYCNAPVVGSGHTVTVSGATTLSTLAVLALNLSGGPFILDQENGAGSTVTNTLACGSITPTRGSAFIASHIAMVGDNQYPPIVNGRQLFGPYTRFNIGFYAGSRIAYGLQDVTPSAVNPTWVGFDDVGISPPPTLAGSVVSFIPATTVTIGLATETDSAFSVMPGVPLGVATETDLALLAEANNGVQILIEEVDIISLAPIALPSSLIPTPQAVELTAAFNWTPLTDIAGSVTGAARDALAGTGRTVRVESVLIEGRQLPSKTYRLPSLFRFETHAQRRAADLMTWLEGSLIAYSLVINRYRNQIELGMTARIVTYPRFGLQNGFTGVVCGWSETPAKGQVGLVLLGPAPA